MLEFVVRRLPPSTANVTVFEATQLPLFWLVCETLVTLPMASYPVSYARRRSPVNRADRTEKLRAKYDPS